MLLSLSKLGKELTFSTSYVTLCERRYYDHAKINSFGSRSFKRQVSPRMYGLLMRMTHHHTRPNKYFRRFILRNHSSYIGSKFGCIICFIACFLGWYKPITLRILSWMDRSFLDFSPSFSIDWSLISPTFATLRGVHVCFLLWIWPRWRTLFSPRSFVGPWTHDCLLISYKSGNDTCELWVRSTRKVAETEKLTKQGKNNAK